MLLYENSYSMMNIKHILAIASAKGGVGKSTIAANMAISLSEEYKVGLLITGSADSAVSRSLAVRGQRCDD